MFYLSSSPSRPATEGDNVLSMFCEYPGDGEFRHACEHLMRMLERAGCDPGSTVFYKSAEMETLGMLVGTARKRGPGQADPGRYRHAAARLK